VSESFNITDLLLSWSNGDDSAVDKLMPLVEAELHRLASRYMRRENASHTLQTTALVNEAYLKLIDQRAVNWQNRTHFFALASKIMRRVLLDYAKSQKRAKRGGKALHLDISEVSVMTPAIKEEIIDLDRALTKLAEFDATKSRIVEMRYFAGLSIEEIAEVLKIAPITVIRHWNLAKAWLRLELEK